MQKDGKWEGIIEGQVECAQEMPASLAELKVGSKTKFTCPETGICPCKVNPSMNTFHEYMYPQVKKTIDHCKGRQGYNIAIVGLGSGGTAHVVRQNCAVNKIFVVEKDPDVYDHAVKYLGFQGNDQPGPMKAIVGVDGEMGLQQLLAEQGESLDAVLIDCMVQGVVPESCRSKNFYNSVKGLLKPGGFAIQWAWKKDLPSTKQGMEAAMGSESNKVELIPYQGVAGYNFIHKA